MSRSANRAQWLRCWGALELIAVTWLCFWGVWVMGPDMDVPGRTTLILSLYAAALLWMGWISPVFIHGDTLAERGLGSWRTCFVRMDNLGSSFRTYGLLAVGMSLVFIALALGRDPATLSRVSWRLFFLKFAAYLVSALIQDLYFFQFMMQRMKTIVTAPAPAVSSAEEEVTFAVGESRPRWGLLRGEWGFLRILPAGGDGHRGRVALWLGFFFCLYHFPNPNLMALALPAGMVWAWIYYRKPNLLALAFGHALVGTVLHRIVLLHMRVGPFYWESDKGIIRKVLPFVGKWFGTLV